MLALIIQTGIKNSLSLIYAPKLCCMVGKPTKLTLGTLLVNDGLLPLPRLIATRKAQQDFRALNRDVEGGALDLPRHFLNRNWRRATGWRMRAARFSSRQSSSLSLFVAMRGRGERGRDAPFALQRGQSKFLPSVLRGSRKAPHEAQKRTSSMCDGLRG